MRDFWRARSPRDRALLVALASIVATALLLALVVMPMERARARMQLELPRARASIAALRRDAAEVRRLKALPAAAAPGGSPLAALATNAGGLAGAQFAVLDARRMRVSGADIGFGPLLEWLGNARVTHGMRVESARLDALPLAGRVRADVVLVRN